MATHPKLCCSPTAHKRDSEGTRPSALHLPEPDPYGKTMGKTSTTGWDGDAPGDVSWTRAGSTGAPWWPR